MRLPILTLLAMACADAAFAQIEIGRGKFEPVQQPGQPMPLPQASRVVCQPDGAPIAKKLFVENIKDAQAALRAKNGVDVLAFVEAARPHALGRLQHAALHQLEVAAHNQVSDDAALIAALEKAVADDCMPAPVRKNYQQMLTKLRSGGGRH